MPSLSFRTADWVKLWLLIMSETDSRVRYLGVRNLSILLTSVGLSKALETAPKDLGCVWVV